VDDDALAEPGEDVAREALATAQRRPGAAPLDREVDGLAQHPGVELALLQVVVGAAPDRLDAAVRVRVAGEHHDGHRGRRTAHRLQGLEPVRVGQPEVEDGAVGRRGQRVGGRRLQRLDPDDLEAAAPQRVLDEPGVAGAVLDEEDLGDGFRVVRAQC